MPVHAKERQRYSHRKFRLQKLLKALRSPKQRRYSLQKSRKKLQADQSKAQNKECGKQAVSTLCRNLHTKVLLNF